MEETLLIDFEKYKGYSRKHFCGEEWAEFDSFVTGFKLALSKIKK